MFNREKAVEVLIDDDFTTIMDLGDVGMDHLEMILRNGHRGYESMAAFELVDELNRRAIDLDQFFAVEVE